MPEEAMAEATMIEDAPRRRPMTEEAMAEAVMTRSRDGGGDDD